MGGSAAVALVWAVVRDPAVGEGDGVVRGGEAFALEGDAGGSAELVVRDGAVGQRRGPSQSPTSTARLSPGERARGAPVHPVGRQGSAQPAWEISELRDGGGGGESLEVVLECSEACVAELAFPTVA